MPRYNVEKSRLKIENRKRVWDLKKIIPNKAVSRWLIAVSQTNNKQKNDRDFTRICAHYDQAA